MTLSALSCGLAALFLSFPHLPGTAGNEGWPQWRGPNRDGVSTERDWSAEGKDEPLWSASLGLGYAAVSIADGRLFTTGYDKDEGLDVIFCLDPETGEELWTHTYEAKIWNELHDGGTLSTPSIDGDLVYVINREGRFTCLRAEDGEVVWRKDIVSDYGIEPPRWGFSCSPLVLDDQIVLNIGRVHSIDKATGEVRWVSENDDGDAYGTPVDFELQGLRALAVLNGEALEVLDLEGGASIARVPWTNRFKTQPTTPVVTERGIFVSSREGQGCGIVDVSGDAPKVVWQNKALQSGMTSCVQVNGRLYGFEDSLFKCIDLEGKEIWRVRGLGAGCVSAAGDRLLALSGKGELIVGEGGGDEFEELSRRKVLDEGEFWTPPVLYKGLIYCRSATGELVCLDHRTN